MNPYLRIGLSALLGIFLIVILASFGIISWGDGALGGIIAVAVATFISILRYKS